MSTTAGRVARWILSAAMVVLLVYLASHVNWHRIGAAVRDASYTLVLAATLVNLVSLALKGVRWWIFLRPAGVRSLGLVMRATFAGAGLNNILVANGGEAARVIFVSRASGVSSATVLASLALERLFDVVGFVVFLVGAGLLLPMPDEISRFRAIAALSLAALAVLLMLLARRGSLATPAALAHSPNGDGSFVKRGRAYMGRVFRSVTALSSMPRFAGALLVTVVVWGTQLATYALAAAAAHAHLSAAGNVVVLLAANLGFLIRTTPGNVGVFQLTYALAAVPLGEARSVAIAAAVLLQALQVIPVTVLGVLLAPEFVLKKRRLPTPLSPVIPPTIEEVREAEAERI